MTKIPFIEIDKLKIAPQHFSDCYLVSSVGALARSKNGRKTLRNNIRYNQNKQYYEIHFLDWKKQKKDIFVSQKEMSNIVLTDKFANPLKLTSPHNPIIQAIECSMNKLIKSCPSVKPLFCRLASSVEPFEYNISSNFMKMFTGVKPISINEKTLRKNLTHHKESVLELFDRMKDNNFSFIAGTSKGTRKFCAWHCYSIEKVDGSNVFLYDHRKQTSINVKYDEFIKSFKYITGYFNDMLK